MVQVGRSRRRLLADGREQPAFTVVTPEPQPAILQATAIRQQVAAVMPSPGVSRIEQKAKDAAKQGMDRDEQRDYRHQKPAQWAARQRVAVGSAGR